jgi:RNA polymerase sigma-70 factor (ECF subfamily)
MKSFLYITTRNACIDYLRKKKKQDISQNEIRYLTAKDVQPVEYEVMSADVLQELVKAIDELPPQCAEVFKAIFFENLSTSQVARKLNISNQNVLNQKAKAIRIMKAALAKKDMLSVALCCCLDMVAMMH